MIKILNSLLVFFLLTGAAAVVVVLAQRTEPAAKAELAEITERGRMLYNYDVAAWHSTDAVLALSPPEGSIERYIARKTASGGWTVGYGKLNEKRDKFLIAYQATQGTAPKEFRVEKFDTPKEDAGFYLFAALAVETATADFKGESSRRPYNAAVLPAKSNQFFVYILPAQTETGVFPLGGDVRYHVSADGLKIVEKRQLHKSIIEFSVPEGIKPETGYHTAVLDDAPEDTDVFHVLTREPKLAELVVTSKYVYRIAVDGTISYLMTREAFTKSGVKP